MFLTDENIPVKIVEYLRSAGYKVYDLREQKIKYLTDDQILNIANEKKFVLLTFDKHFANITKYPPEKYSGIIRIRIHPPIFEDIKNALRNLLDKIDVKNITGKLVILEKKGFRIRKQLNFKTPRKKTDI